MKYSILMISSYQMSQLLTKVFLLKLCFAKHAEQIHKKQARNYHISQVSSI